AIGIEFDNHVRAFVGNPDVVILVDFDGVGEGPGVKMVADFAENFSVWRKFKELRGGGGVGGSSGVAAGEDENVALRIDGNASGFAEIDIWRKFQEIRSGMEADFGRLLGEEWSGYEKERSKNRPFHVMQPRGFINFVHASYADFANQS